MDILLKTVKIQEKEAEVMTMEGAEKGIQEDKEDQDATIAKNMVILLVNVQTVQWV